MPEPIAHQELDLYARVDGTEHVIGQARVPIYANVTGKGDTLRAQLQFSVGDPVVQGIPGWDAKGQGARNALKKWRTQLETDLNAQDTGTP